MITRPAIRSAVRQAVRSVIMDDGLYALIRQLFGAGEQGAFYIPRPRVNGAQSLFQDAKGTTPVTADGDPVGLMLDQSQRLALGAEEIPNPNWDGGYTTNGAKQIPTDWIEYNQSNVSSSTVLPNSYTFTASAHLAGIVYNDIIHDGRFYYVTIKARKTASVSGAPNLKLYSGAWNEIIAAGATVGAWYEKTFRVAFTNDLVIASFDGAATWEIEYISARELKGNHASEATSAKRPSASNVPPWKADFDGVDDELIVSFASSLGSDCTIARAVAGTGASILTGQTIGTSYTIDSDFNALVVVDRALTSSETVQLTAYLNQISGV